MSFEKLIPYEAATLVVEAYMAYYSQYRRITKRARIRFEQKDWHGIQADARARIDLYKDRVGETTDKLLDLLGERSTDRHFWLQTKVHFSQEIANFNTRNIAESFYNSVFRHAHKGELGKDDRLMFVHGRGNYREFKSRIPIVHTLPLSGSLDLSMQYLLQFYHFDVAYEDLPRDIDYLTRRLTEWVEANAVPEFPIQLQVLKSIFYRNKAAYIVGRLIQHGSPVPFIIPILNGPNGLVVDTLLLSEEEISTIFSYNRSYFLVDLDIVSEMVYFLRSVMPKKNVSELYNSIGFEKHGKTVFFREFERHLSRSTDTFTYPAGIKGMVMTVFTLPSFPVVFKVIKDRFTPPKQVTYADVVNRYELINRHDRVGRMSDSYLFQQLSLPLQRIDAEVLLELQKECASRIEFRDENELIIKHAYVEKRMIPLDVYLSRATPTMAREAINEYGKAIKEMA
ncbi:MAG: bifunctional isocitrate dehydrogenase kinase/phosphatase, partial [Bacteroidota bacterium]